MYTPLFLLTALLVSSTGALDQCIPECHNTMPGMAVADPWDCTQFYYCLVNEVPAEEPQACDPGEHFDENKRSCVSGSKCQPKCGACEPSCENHVEGDFVEDPLDCRRFYVCVHEGEVSSHPVTCQPPTPVFDSWAGMCVPGDTCESSCAGGRCHIRCRGPKDRLTNPDNCSEYFVCDDSLNAGGPYVCPSHAPYFDGWGCVDSSFVCCKPECTPYCHQGDVQIIDPYDCTRYYICLSEGPVDGMNRFQCGIGETFQPASSTCETGLPCLTLCGGLPPSTTTHRPVTDSTTTSTTTSSTTTTISTTTNDCITFMDCPGKGNYPMCPFCNPGYFKCKGPGENGVPSVCDDGFLFNSDPSYPFCVDGLECPYTPPLIL